MEIAIMASLLTKGDMQINSCQLRLLFCASYFYEDKDEPGLDGCSHSALFICPPIPDDENKTLLSVRFVNAPGALSLWSTNLHRRL